MSVLERRIQLLLDQERYERLAAEARRSGRSINAVIREAIDRHYPAAAEARSKAILDFLATTTVPDPGAPESWPDIKSELDEAMYRPTQ
jgi:hypothetical protein